MVVKETLGRVTIHPDVLYTIVRMATLATPGVARFDRGLTGSIGDIFSPGQYGGVGLKVEGDRVRVDLHIVADADVGMFQLGRTLQREVGRAIEHMVGMEVVSINVYIEDVDFTP